MGQPARIRQRFQVQNSLPDCRYLAGRNDVACQIFKLLNHVSFARKAPLASAWRLNGFRQYGSIFQKYFCSHHLPEFRASRHDIRISHDFDFVSKRYPDRIDDLLCSELIDKNITVEEERRHAEWQVQLCCGDPRRTILPAYMINGHLRAMHYDVVNLVDRERPSCPNRTNRVKRRVVAAHAGVKLERYLHRLKARPQARG